MYKNNFGMLIFHAKGKRDQALEAAKYSAKADECRLKSLELEKEALEENFKFYNTNQHIWKGMNTAQGPARVRGPLRGSADPLFQPKGLKPKGLPPKKL